MPCEVTVSACLAIWCVGFVRKKQRLPPLFYLLVHFFNEDLSLVCPLAHSTHAANQSRACIRSPLYELYEKDTDPERGTTMKSISAGRHLSRTVLCVITAIFSWPVAAQSVSDILRENNNLTTFSKFSKALDKGNLWEVLDSSKTVTVFVPSDSAIDIDGSAFLLEDVLVTPANHERLVDLLSYHIVLGLIPDFNTAIHPINLETLANECLPVVRIGYSLKIGPEAFVTESLNGDNGQIYIIDRMLWQPYEGSHCFPKSVATLR